MPTSRRRPPLPRRMSSERRRRSKSDSFSARGSWVRSPAAEHDDQGAQPTAVRTVARAAHHGDDLLDGGRVRGVADAFVAGRSTGVESWHRRRRATTSGGVEQQLRHSPSSDLKEHLRFARSRSARRNRGAASSESERAAAGPGQERGVESHAKRRSAAAICAATRPD